MSERPEEAEARLILERELGVALRFVDTDGRVDYLFTTAAGLDGAAEVTRVTNQEAHRSDVAWRTRRARPQTEVLAHCWMVTVDGIAARARDIEARVTPHLRELEEAGCAEFNRLAGRLSDPPLPLAAVRGLLSAKVESASVWPCDKPGTSNDVALDGSGHSHQVLVSRMESFVASGSDAALEEIENDLADRADNATKLGRSGAASRHLFVWLDTATAGSITRPFSGGMIDGWGHFGLPSRAPNVDAVVTDLWIVHEGTRRGWHWSSRDGWRALMSSPTAVALGQAETEED